MDRNIKVIVRIEVMFSPKGIHIISKILIAREELKRSAKWLIVLTVIAG